MLSAITVSKLSKIYKIYPGPRALLKELLFGRKSHHDVLALSEVSFEVGRGEAFGVIGDNGAGKTTLLKILTGTAFPTAGAVGVSGKVSALLELGAGFHAEFTGLENIYFNGALMGLSRDEIQGREQEIVEFSGLEDFIDKPVRTYSSGMYLRLGFSVATGFDPDVLVIDEALAVGDQEFQKKSTDRILDFRKRGKTIFFCSHNLYQVRSICDRAVWLDRGKVQALGSATDVVNRYTDRTREENPRKSSVEAGWKLEDKGPDLCRIDRCRVTDGRGNEIDSVSPGDDLTVETWSYFSDSFEGTPGIVVALVRNDDLVVYAVSSTLDQERLKKLPNSRYYGRIIFPDLQLLSGKYYITVCATDDQNIQCYDILEKAATLTISSPHREIGVVRVEHLWRSR